jgi:SAM-dependent methyltransferase
LTVLDRLGVYLSQRAIERQLPRGKGLRVLELGCGFRARNLLALRKRIAHGVGVDFQIAPELFGLPHLSFIGASIEEALPKLEPESFDVVLLISVLEHLDKPNDVLSKICAVLRPSGTLLLNVPTWRGKFFLEFSAFRLGLSPKMEIDDHKMYFWKEDLWPRLVQAGFAPSCIKLRYHKFGLNLFAVARKN